MTIGIGIDIIIAVQAIVIYIAGICSLKQTVVDKKDPKKAICLLIAGIIMLTAGSFMLFEEVELGIAIFVIGAVVLLVAATTNTRDWQYHDPECTTDGDESRDLVCVLFGIACIAVAIIGYKLFAVGFFTGLLIVITLIALYFAFSQKEAKNTTIPTVVLAIAIFALAIFPYII